MVLLSFGDLTTFFLFGLCILFLLFAEHHQILLSCRISIPSLLFSASLGFTLTIIDIFLVDFCNHHHIHHFLVAALFACQHRHLHHRSSFCSVVEPSQVTRKLLLPLPVAEALLCCCVFLCAVNFHPSFHRFFSEVRGRPWVANQLINLFSFNNSGS